MWVFTLCAVCANRTVVELAAALRPGKKKWLPNLEVAYSGSWHGTNHF